MPLTGEMSTNLNKTENYSITGVKELDSGAVSATGFVNGLRQVPDSTCPNAPPYSNAGLSLQAGNSAGSVGLSGTHIPNKANVLTASTNMHLVHTDTHKLTANAFTTSVMPKAGPNFATHGAGVDYSYNAGSVGLSGTHIPNKANVLTASTNMHLVHTDTHKLTANAFTTSVMPKAGPNFATHGAGVDYSYKDTVGANASVSHTPMFKQTDYSVGGRLNLHQTPTSSLGLNLGATRTESPFSRGNWQPGGAFIFKKTF